MQQVLQKEIAMEYKWLQFCPQIRHTIQLAGDCLASNALDDETDKEIMERFLHDRAEEYAGIKEQCAVFLSDLDKEIQRKNFSFVEYEENEQDFNKLERWFDKVIKRDFIGGEYANSASGWLSDKMGGPKWLAGLAALCGLRVVFGMAYGTANALVADLVPENLRGTAYGTYNAVIGILAFPASLIVGLLWQGLGAWKGFGPSAPFFFGGTLALIAVFLMAFWMPKLQANV